MLKYSNGFLWNKVGDKYFREFMMSEIIQIHHQIKNYSPD